MDNEQITISYEDNWVVITDEATGVTTQGRTKLEALLALTDALAGYTDSDIDLLSLAHRVFIPASGTLSHDDPLPKIEDGIDKDRPIPYVDGHDISVKKICDEVMHENKPPQDVADEYNLKIGDVYRALSYYFSSLSTATDNSTDDYL